VGRVQVRFGVGLDLGEDRELDIIVEFGFKDMEVRLGVEVQSYTVFQLLSMLNVKMCCNQNNDR